MAAANAGAIFAYGSLDFSSFTATLSLLDQRGDTEILSAPRITTLDNQKATIKVIDKIMLQKSVETTDTATLVTVEFESEKEAREVGIKLTVIPHVNDNGEITVNLLPEVSTDQGFNVLNVGALQNTIALTFSSREANTIVRVRDGETVFLGGLIRKNVAKTDNKVPILGDLFGGIPVLGNVFRYEADNTTRTEIVFFVTVHLAEDGVDSIYKTSTEEEYNRYISPRTRKNAPPITGNYENMVSTPVIMQGKFDVVENKVEVPVFVQPVQEKKKKKAFLDFRKKK